MQGSTAVSIPLPRLGDTFVRTNLVERPERVSILHIVGTEASWKAAFIAGSGYDYVDGERKVVGKHEWRPEHWIFDDEMKCFRPPNLAWNPVEGCWEDTSTPEAPIDGPAKHDAPARGPFAEIPSVDQMEKPGASEHHIAYYNRMRQQFPSLRSEAGNLRLREAWAQHKGSL